MCFPPAVSRLVVPILSCHFPIVFPMFIVTSLFLLLHLPSLPVSCPATTRSIALTFPSCSSPWFSVYPDPFPVASLAFPNSDRALLEHIQEPYLHPNLQATLQLRSVYQVVQQQREQSQELQEPELEPVTHSQVEEDHSSLCPLLPLPRIP